MPLVVIDVRGIPPGCHKVEQSDLLAVLARAPGDAPRLCWRLPIEECFRFVVLARRIAESLPHAGYSADPTPTSPPAYNLSPASSFGKMALSGPGSPRQRRHALWLDETSGQPAPGTGQAGGEYTCRYGA